MSAGRVSPIAPIGSLFKAHWRLRNRKARAGGDGRHLAAVRCLPCICCDNDPAGEAAHLRMAVAGKPTAGIGAKPADRWALPLCSGCHTRNASAQHRVGEPKFWQALGLDPFVVAQRLCAASPDIMAMRAVIFITRQGRK